MTHMNDLKSAEYQFLVVTCLALFIPIHLPLDLTARFFPIAAPETVTTFKKVLFAVGILLACARIWTPMKSQVSKLEPRFILVVAAGLASLVLLLPMQFPYFGLRNSGVDYAKLMAEPFGQSTGWYYRRLLPVALPHYLGLTRPLDFAWVSYAYVAFFAIVAAATFKRLMPNLSEAVLALLTASLIGPLLTFAYTYPGYPEYLGLSLYCLTFTFKLKPASRGILMALALSATDQMLFVMVPFELFLRRKSPIAICIGLYLVLWLGTILGLDSTISDQANFMTIPAYHYFALTPGRLIQGVLYSQKLLWILPAALINCCLKLGKTKNALFYALGLIASLSILLVAVDTSRLVNVVLPFIVYAMIWLKRNRVITLPQLILLVAINFVLPSPNYFTHTGWEPGSGLYTTIFGRLIGNR